MVLDLCCDFLPFQDLICLMTLTVGRLQDRTLQIADRQRHVSVCAISGATDGELHDNQSDISAGDILGIRMAIMKNIY